MKNYSFVMVIITMAYMLIMYGCQKPENKTQFDPLVDPYIPHIVENYWWPVQEVPKSVTILTNNGSTAEEMTAQSLIGIAAQNVNRGKDDEMLWHMTDHTVLKRSFNEITKRFSIRINGSENMWDIISRFKNSGKISGYILYSAAGQNCSNTVGEIDCSANTATMLAGIFRAIIIDKSIEDKAIAAGLEMIKDARGMTSDEVFDEYNSVLNNRFSVISDPAYLIGRELVIAQCGTMIHHPKDSFSEKVMNWLEPVSPIIGFWCSDEAEAVQLSSRYGHFNVAWEHSTNVTFLSAGAYRTEIEQIPEFDPRTIDFNDTDKYHSVFISDGDNISWVHNNLSLDTNGWLNPSGKETSVSWTFPGANMVMASPGGWKYYIDTKNENSTLIEYGQYMYPDVFGSQRLGQRKDMLRKMAKVLNEQMKRNGTNILSFICLDSHSENTIEAYEIFAEEIDCLIGCISVQYFPYPDGKGEIDWVKKKDGTEIPVIRPKYCMVGGMQSEEFAAFQGSPSVIFENVNNDNQKMSLSVYHAWSAFSQQAGGHLGPDNTPPALGTVNAIHWAKQVLDPNVHLVSAEELIWRIRMQEKPEETKKLLRLN